MVSPVVEELVAQRERSGLRAAGEEGLAPWLGAQELPKGHTYRPELAKTHMQPTAHYMPATGPHHLRLLKQGHIRVLRIVMSMCAS